MRTIGDSCIIQGEIKFEWKIKNFLKLISQEYRSPVFIFCGVSWRIRICPYKVRDGIEYIGLYIIPMSLKAPITMDYTLYVKTVYEIAYREIYGTDVFFTYEDRGWGTSTYIPRSRLEERKSELLPSGVLTVICILKKGDTDVEDASSEDLSSAVISNTDLSKNKVLQDFKELYLNQTDCDVIFKVKGREFPAHQALLKARSPVLCSTFQIDMKERVTGVVELVDCDPSSFSNFLCFLYCGEVENLSAENVFSLFTTADKYGVMDLRSQCLRYIKANLTVDAFCDTMSLALLYAEDDLIQLSTNFFIKNIKNIIVTEKWPLFLSEYPTEGNQLLVKTLIPNKDSNV